SFVFFFSSRRRHTRWPRDWSSDVCSSDLGSADELPRRRGAAFGGGRRRRHGLRRLERLPVPQRVLGQRHRVQHVDQRHLVVGGRSEERRVGKECRSRGWLDHEKKKIKGIW